MARGLRCSASRLAPARARRSAVRASRRARARDRAGWRRKTARERSGAAAARAPPAAGRAPRGSVRGAADDPLGFSRGRVPCDAAYPLPPQAVHLLPSASYKAIQNSPSRKSPRYAGPPDCPHALTMSDRVGAGGITMRYQGILDTIGRTPVVRLNRLAPEHVNLYVKLEAFNPMGSVKDRLALGVIEHAERDGVLQPGPDRRRGDQRQHRHRPRDGVRREGLSARGDDGGELQRRAAPPDAVPRRARRADAGGAEGQRHARQGARARRTRTAGSSCRQFENEANADVHSRTTRRRDPRGLPRRPARLPG